MFDLSHKPEIGVAEQLAEGLQVVTAPNASPMTFTGTRSYLLGENQVAIIDPGPDHPAHFSALVSALAGRALSHILVTHSHIDHSPLARRLAQEYDAPIMAFGPSHAGRSPIMQLLAEQGELDGGEGVDTDFTLDIQLQDGEVIKSADWELEAIHTPGHLSNHLCFAWQGNLFSGDHIMGWSTTLISAPDGDLTQFMCSINKLRHRNENTYFAGHGAVLENAQEMLEYQHAHRLRREAQILEALNNGLGDIAAITRKIYADINPLLWPMAERNVLSHLIDLIGQSKVASIGPLRFIGRFEALV